MLSCGFLVCCYVLCGDVDWNLVYYEFVVLLRKIDFMIGFIFEEFFMNKSGKLVFEI